LGQARRGCGRAKGRGRYEEASPVGLRADAKRLIHEGAFLCLLLLSCHACLLTLDGGPDSG
jgi:hypothetical protein